MGFGLPGTRAKSTVDLQGLEQPLAGGVLLVEGGVEQPMRCAWAPMKQTKAALTAQESATGSSSSMSRWHKRAVLQCDRGGGHLAYED